MSMPQVIVIGAGVIGLGCAFALLKKGASVVVLDTLDQHSASQQAAGALRPFDAHRDTRKANLQRRSLLMYPDFIAALEPHSQTPTEYTRCQRLVPLLTAGEYANLSHKAHAAARNWPQVDGLDAQTLLPANHMPQGVYAPYGALLCRHTACLNPQKLMQALREAVMALGGEILTRTATKVEETTGGVRVHLKGGKFIEAHNAVLAAGPESKTLVSALKNAPLHARYRQAVTLRLKEGHSLNTMLEGAGGVYLVPRADGQHVYIGAEDLPPWATAEADPAVTQTLLAAASQVFPAIEQATVVQTHVGRVPRMARGHAMLVGKVPHHQHTFIAAGHGGVGYGLMPLTAQAIADLVTHGETEIELAEISI